MVTMAMDRPNDGCCRHKLEAWGRPGAVRAVQRRAAQRIRRALKCALTNTTFAARVPCKCRGKERPTASMIYCRRRLVHFFEEGGPESELRRGVTP